MSEVLSKFSCDHIPEGDSCGLVVTLIEQNAKLRELVKDFLDVPCQCLKCEHYNYEEDRCGLRDRACELGVEVD